jgi:[acyl-carrier-protein] S-malonyltransferase
VLKDELLFQDKMSKIAFIFPGQGSQYVGMGKEFFENFPLARQTFEEADDALQHSLSRLCFEGPETELNLTFNTQPAILTVSAAILKVLSAETSIRPSIVAGHSLGEYTSLFASRALPFPDGVRITRLRGKFMQEAVPVGEGGMAAIIGLPKDEVEMICGKAAAGQVVSPANYNSPEQIVISGHKEAIERASSLALERGARVFTLPVSAPFHCSLMKPAAEKLEKELQKISFSEIETPVISNVEADLYPSKEEIQRLLTTQVDHPVRWEESMNRLIQEGIDTVVEAGPGRVLSGLMKRINRDVKILNVEDINSLKNLEKSC